MSNFSFPLFKLKNLKNKKDPIPRYQSRKKRLFSLGSASLERRPAKALSLWHSPMRRLYTFLKFVLYTFLKFVLYTFLKFVLYTFLKFVLYTFLKFVLYTFLKFVLYTFLKFVLYTFLKFVLYTFLKFVLYTFLKFVLYTFLFFLFRVRLLSCEDKKRKKITSCVFFHR